MPARLPRWMLLCFLFLAFTSVVGGIVRGVVQPKDEDHSYYYGGTTYTPPPTYRNDLPIGPQPFDETPVPRSPDNTLELLAIREMLDAGVNTSQNAWPATFHLTRMAEDWVRFGVDNRRGRNTTNQSLANDASTIRDRMAAKPFLAGHRFDGVPEIVWTRTATNGNDRMVYVKHTAKDAVWYGRYWLTQQGLAWRVYDFEVQPHRLRYNSLLAAEEALMYRAMPTATMKPDVREAYVQELCDRFAEQMTHRGTTKARSIGPRFQYEAYYIPPLEPVRTYVEHRHQLQAGISEPNPLANIPFTWPDSPVAGVMQPKARDAFVDLPWRPSKPQNLAARVKAMPGQPVLIAQYARSLPIAERGIAGELAARCHEPGAALQEVLAACPTKTVTDWQPILDAYRKARPDDAVGLSIAAAIAIRSGAPAEAAALFAHAWDQEPHRATTAEVFAEFTTSHRVEAMTLAAPESVELFREILATVDADGPEALELLETAKPKLETTFWWKAHMAAWHAWNGHYETALDMLPSVPEEPMPDKPLAHEFRQRTKGRCLWKLNRLNELRSGYQAEAMMIEAADFASLKERLKTNTGALDSWWRARLAFEDERYTDAIRGFNDYTWLAVDDFPPRQRAAFVDTACRTYLRTAQAESVLPMLETFFDGRGEQLRILAAYYMKQGNLPSAKLMLQYDMYMNPDALEKQANDPDLKPWLPRLWEGR